MSEPQLVDLIDFTLFTIERLYGDRLTKQIIRNFIREYSQKEGL